MKSRESDMALDVSLAAAPSVVRGYYELTKPGITQMVVLSTLAGYYLAIPGDVLGYLGSTANWLHGLATIFGTVLVSAGSCVVNHIMERGADARMKRTATRPIPSGLITVRSASLFAAVLTVAGLALLSNINTLTFVLAVITWLSYVVVYTPLKRTSSLAVVVGGIPGALPFVGGWTAVTGAIEAPAVALFAILFFWQLPHFYALSWMYRNDYRDGGFALRSIRDNNHTVLAGQTIGTSVLTMGAALTPTLLGVTGWLYGSAALALGAWLVVESVRFLRIGDNPSARRVLLTSYAFLMGIVVLMFLDKA